MWSVDAKLFRLLSLALFISLVTCASNDAQVYTIKGEISQNHLNYLEGNQQNISRIIVDSSGGNSLISAKIGLIILNNNIDLEVDYRCISSCVEFLMTAARNVYVRENSIIAVHGNPFTTEFFLRKHEIKNFCEHSSHEILQEIYLRRKLLQDFSMQQISRLGMVSQDVEGPKGCQVPIVELEAYYWYPTSAQLDSYLNLRIDGKLCADDLNCSKENLIGVKNSDKKCVVGETLKRCKF